MNEHHPHHDNNHGLPEHLRPGPQAEQTIRRALEAARSIEGEACIVEGYLNHGTAFAAYLRLDDTATSDPGLIDRFRDVHSGSWEKLDQLIDDELDGLGWRQELNTLRREHGIDPEFLDWNRPAFEAHLHELYSVVELDSWQHVFYR